MIYFTLKIVAVHNETDDTVTVSFKQPGLKKVKYKAGQYLTLTFNINNRKYSRAYSLSSAPGVEDTLNITVKRVSGGIVSNHIADCLSVGDLVEVMEPIGDFTLENKNITSDNCIVLWAAGSGITPLISIAKFALQNKAAKHVTLVYGNRDQERTIFNDQILVLQKQYAGNFTVWHFHTEAFIDEKKPGVIQGRIDAKKVLDVLRHENGFAQTFHYICGPAGLKESVKEVLEFSSVPKENIFVEEFSLTADPEKFDGIVTRNITIKKASVNHQVEVSKGKTILDAGLDALIDLPYSCQTGNCSICKATLAGGQIRSIANTFFSKNLQQNECLLCCALPLTDDVLILVD